MTHAHTHAHSAHAHANTHTYIYRHPDAFFHRFTTGFQNTIHVISKSNNMQEKICHHSTLRTNGTNKSLTIRSGRPHC